ncbi:Ribosomal protein S18 acetylase RimI [Cupriavidus sp. YR651]|uniref:GNAT family N-acetyltransferase n=1 Tax=Cupriavidus sp. YR651 TaxID=1855315 RepID=UPI000882F611|nr:GNAT family N-acetyltransferase [Cupriavidus sp. YR651]SDC70302.1 Ribosomal protein S18 acetylase RimI [Cupriavidus sp. YR651]
MTNITFRTAQFDDLPAIVGLLADDPLGRLRETVSDPVDPRYVAAFRAIEADANQRLVVAVERATADDTQGRMQGDMQGDMQDAVQGERIVGTFQLSFLPGIARHGAWRGQIEAVRIAASHRSGGIGQQMFEWAIAECRAWGCQLVQLTTDKGRPDAHRFYEKLGFVASHEGYKLALDSNR